MLEHELFQAEAGESIICYPIIKQAGWDIMPVAQCVGDPIWYVEWENRTTSTAVSVSTPTGGSTASVTSTTTKSSAGRNAIGVTLAMVSVGAVVALLL